MAAIGIMIGVPVILVMMITVVVVVVSLLVVRPGTGTCTGNGCAADYPAGGGWGPVALAAGEKLKGRGVIHGRCRASGAEPGLGLDLGCCTKFLIFRPDKVFLLCNLPSRS